MEDEEGNWGPAVRFGNLKNRSAGERHMFANVACQRDAQARLSPFDPVETAASRNGGGVPESVESDYVEPRPSGEDVEVEIGTHLPLFEPEIHKRLIRPKRISTLYEES